MLVTSQKEADKILDDLSQCSHVAIDSEFHWTRTYHPIPALIQLGVEDRHYLLDVRAFNDYSSLGRFLGNEDCCKIIHSCSQDLILFYLMTSTVTRNIFDSQIAYSFLHERHQISFGGMVEDITGETLSKGSQRSDWLRRPLSERQLEYAANDVIWLMKCFPTLKSELEKQQRTQWLKSECQLYEDESFYQKPLPQNLYHRIKGAGRLNREQLAILRELAAWREDVAIKLDLRPKIFLSEPTLFSIVYNKPSNTKDLKNCRDMPPQVMHYNSRDILNCIDVGLSLDEDQKPALIEKRIPSKKEEKFADTLYQMALNKSQQLQMATNLLITKTQCKKIASWNFKELAFDFSNMIQWRQDILKDDILKISQKFS